MKISFVVLHDGTFLSSNVQGAVFATKFGETVLVNGEPSQQKVLSPYKYSVTWEDCTIDGATLPDEVFDYIVFNDFKQEPRKVMKEVPVPSYLMTGKTTRLAEVDVPPAKIFDVKVEMEEGK